MLQGSQLVTGSQNLLSDAAVVLTLLAAAIGVVCIIYFAIRMGASDEMDRKMWSKRLVAAIIATILAVSAAAILSTVLSYYK
ncbi:hypothetical protein [Eubacterium aggregans]|uniref:hypothetical protein n=1 Tax=Eubacterium aggregans TaxID=81409 RepID=UPI003F2C4816